MIPENEIAIALGNQRQRLFLMKSEIRQMIASRHDSVLKLEIVRELDDATLEMMKTVLGKVVELSRQAHEANGGKIFALGIEEICSCSIHVEHMKRTGLELSKGVPAMTLAGFLFPREPIVLLRALVAAEKEVMDKGRIRQPQLFTSMLAKIDYWVRTKNVLGSGRSGKPKS